MTLNDEIEVALFEAFLHVGGQLCDSEAACAFYDMGRQLAGLRGRTL